MLGCDCIQRQCLNAKKRGEFAKVAAIGIERIGGRPAFGAHAAEDGALHQHREEVEGPVASGEVARVNGPRPFRGQPEGSHDSELSRATNTRVGRIALSTPFSEVWEDHGPSPCRSVR